MATIRISTDIRTSPETCFDLARSVDAHLESARHTRERVVGGVSTGLLTLGDEVTWEARHFGVTQRLTSRITVFDPPHHFRDEMVRGAFARFVHDHRFDAVPSVTRMIDVVEYAAPFGLLGRLAESLFLTTYLTRFLQQRAAALKALAEAGR